jgi:predicted nucleic acid-binding protein
MPVARGSKQPNPAIELLEKLEAEDIEFFRQFDGIADEAISRVSRALPPEFYEDVREGMLASLMSVIGGGRLRVTLVMDSCIVVADAFRVAQGKPSTTERLMASTFVRLVAPRDIAREVREQVVKDLPKNASLDVARTQVERLLGRIEIVSDPSIEALRVARKKLAERDPGDVPFLAVLIDSEGEGIVSRDKRAFDSLAGARRWELREMAELVTTYESGTLALGIGAATGEALLDLGSKLLTAVAKAIVEAFTIFANIIIGLASGAAEALANVPGWAWVVLGVVGGAVAIAAILNEDFREWLLSGLTSIGQILYKAARTILEAVATLVQAVYATLTAIWELVRPAVLALGKASLVGAGVLLRKVMLLLDECTRAVDSASAQGTG